ncbi:hypothetical protein CAPTEDRAFT_139636 [Capitella teleta]|uniref:Uncharacterized protein n=1 Tax=Capitella teleta TaxID=283909 RepID=R7TL31_CAPTE|nr:hypothetical protein CAPTEDRAFT_139636 [Capitella teleta]|eukprot:ELT94227.1 hypothetical protein CAPTEDRAFT_139636 [Capitella teleta]
MPEILKKVNDVILPAMICTLMLCMACGVSAKDLKQLARRPFPVFIGIVSQFVVMPACAFGYAHALGLSPLHSISLVVVSSCPGGVISNIFTHWTRGDLPLSILMTLVSTVLAMGFMPLNMFLYLRQWTDENVRIPFIQNALIILMTWIPVFIGLFIRHNSAKVATWIANIGGAVNMLFIVIAVLLQNFMSPNFFHMSPSSWIAGSTLPLIGFCVGLLTSSAACLGMPQRKTVAFETGIQNVGVAGTLISLSFDLDVASILSQIPIVFTVGQLSVGFLVTFLHRISFWFMDKKQKSNEQLDKPKDGLLLSQKEQTEESL